MKKIYSDRIVKLALTASISLLGVPLAHADEYGARNFLTIATGSVPLANDPRVKLVESQLDAIQYSCKPSSRSGIGIHDQIAKAHSLLKTNQSLLELLFDFARIADAQCAKVQSSTLLSLYVLERNSGETHVATVMQLRINPQPLIAKWTHR